ncbi:unnamed protein product, partial [Brenthis ino]
MVSADCTYICSYRSPPRAKLLLIAAKSWPGCKAMAVTAKFLAASTRGMYSRAVTFVSLNRSALYETLHINTYIY